MAGPPVLSDLVSAPNAHNLSGRGGRTAFKLLRESGQPRAPLSRAVLANVNPSSIIFTDDWPAYKPPRRTYIDHRVINHSEGLYVRGNTHTNTVEGFFGNLETGMRGAYKKVSLAYLQSYVDEYAWRSNARHKGRAMFEQLIQRAANS